MPQQIIGLDEDTFKKIEVIPEKTVETVISINELKDKLLDLNLKLKMIDDDIERKTVKKNELAEQIMEVENDIITGQEAIAQIPVEPLGDYPVL
ncbi:MAG: hypothetical protein M1308_15665 [Actinobacteria bacterium]|nr:hypothetical protein [Actinomycetota bacterium]